MYKIADKIIKIIEETMNNWRVELTAKEKKFSWGKNPDRYITERFAMTITVCNSGGTT